MSLLHVQRKSVSGMYVCPKWIFEIDPLTDSLWICVGSPSVIHTTRCQWFNVMINEWCVPSSMGRWIIDKWFVTRMVTPF
jgi:hypothetical protein